MLCLEKSPMVPSHRMTRVEGGRSQIWTFFFCSHGFKIKQIGRHRSTRNKCIHHGNRNTGAQEETLPVGGEAHDEAVDA